MTTIKMLDNEFWWFGSVNVGHEMPFDLNTDITVDLDGGRENDQFAPLMLSSKGRYIWSEKSFSVTVKNGVMTFNKNSEIVLKDGFENLKGAYLAAMKAHFPFDGKMPDELFWTAPQYNTWIELGTEQTTEKIYAYAKSIVENGLDPGVLMIDEGWQEDYGMFEFHKGKIPDPKKLMDELHDLGFKVMLWVSPIVASAGTNYKKLRDKGYLIKNADGTIAVREWWSGFSAVLDLTNPDAVSWYHSQLKSLMERYDVDGFKFDAGDRYFYKDADCIVKRIPARDHTAYFNEIGLEYPFNEYRAAWKFGGKAIVARLHDKYHTWDDFGINTLIPHTVIQGLSGYGYCCPDMVGGGILDCFNKGQQLDEELFVRWAQANALMSMMQVSVAPWRVLSEENYRLVKDAIQLHSKYSDHFISLAKETAKTGEPVVRHMAYEFPDEGFEKVNTQFMVGNDMLVAPVVEKGTVSKDVILPKGRWEDSDGRIYDGGCTVTVDAPINKLNYFIKVK